MPHVKANLAYVEMQGLMECLSLRLVDGHAVGKAQGQLSPCEPDVVVRVVGTREVYPRNAH